MDISDKKVLNLYNRVKGGTYPNFESGFKTMVEDGFFIDNDRPDVAEKFWRLENQDSIGLHADNR